MNTYDKVTQKHSFDSKNETFSITTERKSKMKIHQREIPSVPERKVFLPFHEYVKTKNNLIECSTCLTRTSGAFHQPPDEASNYQQPYRPPAQQFHPEEPPKFPPKEILISSNSLFQNSSSKSIEFIPKTPSAPSEPVDLTVGIAPYCPSCKHHVCSCSRRLGNEEIIFRRDSPQNCCQFRDYVPNPCCPIQDCSQSSSIQFPEQPKCKELGGGRYIAPSTIPFSERVQIPSLECIIAESQSCEKEIPKKFHECQIQCEPELRDCQVQVSSSSDCGKIKIGFCELKKAESFCKTEKKSENFKIQKKVENCKTQKKSAICKSEKNILSCKKKSCGNPKKEICKREKKKVCSKKSSSSSSTTSSSSTCSSMGQGDVGSCCAKYILCMFNFIFFILGSLIVGLGLWLLIDRNSLISLMKSVDSEHAVRFTEPQLIDQTVYIILAIGGIMFFLGFLGYCGAIRESQCLLSLYGVFLIILLVLEIVVFVFAFAYQDVARDETESFLKSTIKEYRSSAKEKDTVTLMWNQLMAQFKCCGVNSYSDFESSPLWLQNKSSRQIPEACCVLSDKTLLIPQDMNCPYAPNDINSYYMKGCNQTIMEYLQINCNIIIGVVSGLILIQLLAAFLAFCIS